MHSTSTSSPAARLRRHLDTLIARPSPDAELLARFIGDRDEAAFAQLVARHGPAVLAVCQRITGNRHDADDAFQATFLALARKANRVRAEAVGAWLFGAAVRAARGALAHSCRRRARESLPGELPDVPERPPAHHDPEAVRAVLEEVARLPTAYRAAVVLCELEGRSRAAAARELGVPEGTLSSRLAAARKRLAARLGDRGLAPAVLAAVAGGTSCPALAVDAARFVALSGSYSPRVEQLSEELVRTSFASKWWAVPAAILVALGLAAAAERRPVPTPTAPIPAGAARPGGRLLLMRDSGFAVLTPGGAEVAAGKIATQAGTELRLGWLSPDGTRLAYLTGNGFRKRDRDRRPLVEVRDVAGERFATTVDVDAVHLCWAADGRSLFATACEDNPGQAFTDEHVRIDLTERAVSKMPWPSDVFPVDRSADGKTVLIIRPRGGKAGATEVELAAMSADGKTVTALTERNSGLMYGVGRLSPDGKRVLFSDVPPDTPQPTHDMTRRLYALDLATKKKSEVAGVPAGVTVFACCWSQDGTKIAYTRRQRHADVVKELNKKGTTRGVNLALDTEMALVVADADGTNAKVIASEKMGDALGMAFHAIDWR